MKKSIVLISLILVLSIIITSCSPKTPDVNVSDEETSTETEVKDSDGEKADVDEGDVTLKFSCWSDTIGTPDEVNANLIAPFKEKTGINVELEILPWSEYWTKLQALSATGDMPDVFCMSAAYAWEYADKELAMDLQPYFDRDLVEDDYFMPVTEYGWIRYPDSTGDLYAVPFRWVMGGLFYNKDIFDEAGVEYPQDDWTYDDMLDAAKKLTKDTDGDGEPDIWGMYVQADHILYDPMVYSNGGSVLDPEAETCNLTEPAAMESLQWIVDAIHKEEVSPPLGLVGAEEGQFKAGVFPSGTVAMVVDGSYNIATWKDLPFNWDVVSQPAGKVSKAVYGGPDSFSIASSTNYSEESWEFIKNFLSPEVQYDYGVVGIGSVPFLKAAINDDFYKSEGLPEHFKLMVDSNPYIRFTDFGNRWMEWRISIMTNELEPALLGEMEPSAAAESACSSITQTLWP